MQQAALDAAKSVEQVGTYESTVALCAPFTSTQLEDQSPTSTLSS